MNIQDFLTATGWKKFATIDFVHYCNRKGQFISDEEAASMLIASPLVEPTQDGMWKAK